MNTESKDKDYEIPCHLLPVTEFDMSEGISPEQMADAPVGGFVRNELLHEVMELDFSQIDRNGDAVAPSSPKNG